MGNYIKYDVEQFDYDTRYNLYSEHVWDSMKNDSKVKKHFEDREEIAKPYFGFQQWDEEKTGQIGTMF